MQKIDKKRFDELISRLVKEFEPEQIFLFGSHAWGTPHPDSDVDLLIIVDDTDIAPTRRAGRAYRCLRGVGIPVEIIVSTRDEVERYRSVRASLTRKILEQGRMVYGQCQD